MMYEAKNGEVYVGETAEQVVAAMRASSAMTADESLDGYMRHAGARYARFASVIIRTDTAENFLADLVAAELLKVTP